MRERKRTARRHPVIITSNLKFKEDKKFFFLKKQKQEKHQYDMFCFFSLKFKEKEKEKKQGKHQYMFHLFDRDVTIIPRVEKVV